MRYFVSILMSISVFCSANFTLAQCLDYDAVLPLIGEAGCPNELVSVDVWQSWAFAIDSVSYYDRLLVVYSLNDPADPQQVATLPMPDHANQILCRDGRAYIVDSYNNYDDSQLIIVDISNPVLPVELTRIPIASPIGDIDVEGNLCALATENLGLLLLDVTFPEFSSVIGTFVPPGYNEEPNSVDIRGNKILLGCIQQYDGSIYLIDIWDPSNPVEAGYLYTHNGVGSIVMLDDDPLALVYHDGHLNTLDFSDSSDLILTVGPRVVGSRITLSNDMAFCVGWNNEPTTVVDISDPFDMKFLAEMGDFARGAAPKGDYLVLARPSGLAVVEVSSPEEMPVVGVLPDQLYLHGILPTGNPDIIFAYYSDDLHVIDFSDPSLPRRLTTLNCDSASSSSYRDSLVYVCDNSGTFLLDITNPAEPIRLANLNLPGEEEVILWHEDLMYLASGLDDLHIMDISDPAHPVPLGYMQTPGFAGGLTFYHQYLILGDGYSGLKVIDVENSASPQLIGQVVGGMKAEFLAVEGDRCFAAGRGYLNLVEIDLSDPTIPTTVASVTMPSRPLGMLLKDGQLWVNNLNGIWIYNIDTPGELFLDQTIPLPVQARGLLPVQDMMAILTTQLYLIRPPCVPVSPVIHLPELNAGSLVAVPNPFNAQVRIKLHLPESASSRLEVYDLKGRLVKILHEGWLVDGPHQFDWNGRNDSGRMMASGVYFTRFVAGSRVETGKIVLAK